MASQKDAQASQSTLPISPSVIVGIVILCAFCAMVLIASVFGYCRNNRSSTTTDLEFEESLNGINRNRPLTASQAARMKEVRWINNMYAWERARHARKEVGGETRSAAVLVGRVGEERHWDEWSSIGTGDKDSSSGGKTFKNSVDDYTRAPLLYGGDDPYARSSHHRSSHHLMPSSARCSYMSGSQYSGLPQYPSMLLPQPIQRDMIQSPFRRRYPPREIAEPIEQPAMQNQATNPKVTINNGVEDLARCSGTTYDTNTEGFAMHNKATERPGPMLGSTPEDDQVRINDSFSALPLSPHTPNPPVVRDENDQAVVVQQELRPAQSTRAGPGQSESRPFQEGVRAMIEEWEETNGRFGRHSGA
ncbi:hypothetical protein PV08_11415 [Exophiala spinifera]|uniref:Uncharacterized protein n=1 Tax=Exophiala spinifera TaxID=91928 RepID=A0A0D1Y6E8_9EURO|nr:uncharacterized protein PV08_11415 [Exophiala spinifera]KIW10451.1 hypothetical protein PV08_11415 [Exophiala spinifera]